jgi:hypothetical protein
MPELTPDEHRQRHIELHRAFDELVADWIAQAPSGSVRLPTEQPIMALMRWSHRQTINPDAVGPSHSATVPRAVFFFPNGQVAVTDTFGKQIPALQGHFNDVAGRILLWADEDTEFHGWPMIADGGHLHSGKEAA